MFKLSLFPIFVLIFFFNVFAQNSNSQIILGIAQQEKYLPLLKNKKTALCVNHTSKLEDKHLVDILLEKGINIEVVFSPEHGFFGNEDNGKKIENQKTKYNFRLESLYGNNKKPTTQQLEDVEVMIFDIQDVGTRFYTYISTMHYVMEACAEANIPIIILDRPNPNGSYIDGPILEMEHQSFVGMHSIPIVHGLTIGELAQMINKEGWLKNSNKCDLTIISMKNWTHQTKYSLPIKPSPNLPNDLSIALYPSLCLFEQTIVSVGRGTDYQFQVLGHPEFKIGNYEFIPQPKEGANNPVLKGQKCKGYFLGNQEPKYEFSLKYLIEMYHYFAKNTQLDFFLSGFHKLAGTKKLQQQIEAGFSEEEIRKTWQKDIENYKVLRSKYLIYP